METAFLRSLGLRSLPFLPPDFRSGFLLEGVATHLSSRTSAGLRSTEDLLAVDEGIMGVDVMVCHVRGRTDTLLTLARFGSRVEVSDDAAADLCVERYE